MTMEVVHSIDVKTTPERIYDALATQQGLAGWYTPNTRAVLKIGSPPSNAIPVRAGTAGRRGWGDERDPKQT
jgi:hypothetical protein